MNIYNCFIISCACINIYISKVSNTTKFKFHFNRPLRCGRRYISSGIPVEVLYSFLHILWVFQSWTTPSNSFWIMCMKQKRSESLKEVIKCIWVVILAVSLLLIVVNSDFTYEWSCFPQRDLHELNPTF